MDVVDCQGPAHGFREPRPRCPSARCGYCLVVRRLHLHGSTNRPDLGMFLDPLLNLGWA